MGATADSVEGSGSQAEGQRQAVPATGQPDYSGRSMA